MKTYLGNIAFGEYFIWHGNTYIRLEESNQGYKVVDITNRRANWIGHIAQVKPV